MHKLGEKCGIFVFVIQGIQIRQTLRRYREKKLRDFRVIFSVRGQMHAKKRLAEKNPRNSDDLPGLATV